MIKLDKSPYPNAKLHALLPPEASSDGCESFRIGEGNRTLASSAPIEAAGALQFEPIDPAAQLSDRRGKFSDAERDNILCLLASPDGRFGSIKLNAKAQIYTCQLGAGHQIYYRTKPDHDLWLSPSQGEIELDGVKLPAGHSATASDQKELTITALSDSEFLLVVLW